VIADTSLALPTTGRWNIDEVHSTASFSVRHHAVGTFRAGFGELTGAYDARTRELVGKVKVANIQAPVPMLYRHLQSPDFFDAETYPFLSFRSTSIVGTSRISARTSRLRLRLRWS
jgi:polyisoprenoid-binding protein YceI